MNLKEIFKKFALRGLNKTFIPIYHDKKSVYYDVNFLPYIPGPVNSESKLSAYILVQAFKHLALEKKYIHRVKEIQEIIGEGTTLWGLRYENNQFSLEFYFFHPKIYPHHSLKNLGIVLNPYLKNKLRGEEPSIDYGCVSYNLHTTLTEHINLFGGNVLFTSKSEILDSNIYENEGSSIEAFSYIYNTEIKSLERENSYYAFFGKESSALLHEKLKICCQDMFPSTKFNPIDLLSSLPYLHQNKNLIQPFAFAKKRSAIGLYFNNLSVYQFVEFLKHHEYPRDFIDELEREVSTINHMQYDVVIDFYLQNNEIHIKKTAFFGTF